MTTPRPCVVAIVVCAALSGCLPATSTKFSIVRRSDPLSDVPALEQLCHELGLIRQDAVGPPQPPKGTFVCKSAPTRGYFIVFTPEQEKKQVDVYFAEIARDFSPEAKAVYSNLVRGLQKRFGEAVNNAPTI